MTNWVLMCVIGILGIFLYFSLNRKINTEKSALIVFKQKI
jgi:hypothetical protein